jgi:hypothetical protein
MSRRVAFHAYRVETGPGIGDRKIEAECAAIARPAGLPTVRLQEGFDRFGEAVVLVISRFVVRTLLCHHSVRGVRSRKAVPMFSRSNILAEIDRSVFMRWRISLANWCRGDLR